MKPFADITANDIPYLDRDRLAAYRKWAYEQLVREDVAKGHTLLWHRCFRLWRAACKEMKSNG